MTINQIEKEILEKINRTADKLLGYKFKSLKDTCANPNPPYTAKITPLILYLTSYIQMLDDNYNYLSKKHLFTEEQMDYFVQNSPLDILYPAHHFNNNNDLGYFNTLLVAIDKSYEVPLTYKQYDFLVRNSDLQTNYNAGCTALLFAWHKRCSAGGLELEKNTWEALKKSAVTFTRKYLDDLLDLCNNSNENYYIVYPRIHSDMIKIMEEQLILANKDELNNILKSDTKKVKIKI